MSDRKIAQKGLTFPAIAALGLAAFGAWTWRKQQRGAGTYDGNGDGHADNAPTARNIDVGTNPAAQPVV